MEEPDLVPPDLRQFYWENYRLELETRNAIDNRVAFSVGLAVVLAGVPGFFLSNLPSRPAGGVSFLFWALFGVGTLLLSFGVVFLASATWAKEFRSYKLLGPLDREERYRRGFFEMRAVKEGRLDPGLEFDRHLVRHLSDAAARNQNLNVKRALRWFRGTGFVLAAIGVFCLDAVPFFLLRGVGVGSAEPIQVELVMPEENKPAQPQDSGGGTDQNPVSEPPLRDTASDHTPGVETRVDEGGGEKK